MSNGKSIHKKSSKPGSGTATSTTHPSLPIYVPSTAPSIEDWLTSLREDSPASPIVSQDNGREKQTSETCGLIPRESSMRWDRDMSCWRTSQASFLEMQDGLPMGARLSESFPSWGTTVNGELWEQEMLAHPTSESGGGVSEYPTPTALPYGTGNNYKVNEGQPAAHRPSLDTMARSQWPTPDATNVGDGTPYETLKTNMTARRARTKEAVKRGEVKPGSGRSENLVMKVAEMETWATPVAPAPHDSQNSAGAYRKPRAGYGVELPNQAIDSQLGPQAPQTETVGQESSPSVQNSPRPSPKRLNPNFVEWLMGIPIGWTDLKPLETASYHQWYENFSEGSDA